MRADVDVTESEIEQTFFFVSVDCSTDTLVVENEVGVEFTVLIDAAGTVRAKGLVMMREQGFMDKPGEETRAKLEELKFLESSIGPTGMLAMNPFLRLSQKDLWQIYMLSS